MAFPDTPLTIQWTAGPPYELIDSVKMYNRVDVNLNLLALRVVDTGWTVPGLSNSWAALGSGFDSPQYRLKAGIVFLGGMLTGGTIQTTVFTLPVGMRPLSRLAFVGESNGGVARIDIFNTGVLQVFGYAAGGSNAFVSLQGVTFIAEQ